LGAVFGAGGSWFGLPPGMVAFSSSPLFAGFAYTWSPAVFSVLLSGPKPYVDTLATLYGLTQSEREHLLYSVKGNALLVRQGDPRPRKTRTKPHSIAL